MKTVCAIVVALGFAASVVAETINVPAGGDIQAAIDGASDGDIIQLEAGEYFPAATIDTLGKEVTLRGEVGKGKDDAPTTVIDGQDSIRVLICENEETALTVFENLLITGGLAGGNSPNNRGGGMRNSWSSSPTLINCTFENNSAYYGGGMNNIYSSPTLEGCTFRQNSAVYGGGMFNELRSPTLTGCTFTDNSADYGGGMYNLNGSGPTLEGCTFRQNSAVSGGGMLNGYCSPMLTNCTFTENSAAHGGGMTNILSWPTLENCAFTDNSADYGGGMYNIKDSSLILTNCTFADNSADYGGGMYNGDGSSPTLENCTFTECCQVYPPNSFIDNGGNDYDSWCDDCRADVDCNDEVNAADLGLILSAWNTTEAQYDIDGNGVVGGGDLGMLLGTWGVCP